MTAMCARIQEPPEAGDDDDYETWAKQVPV
jgi:uncharacterized phage protein gp47/JayE